LIADNEFVIIRDSFVIGLIIAYVMIGIGGDITDPNSYKISHREGARVRLRG
jgi:hypothetical protein